MKKKLNTAAVMNELRGESAFFPPSLEAQGQHAVPHPSAAPHVPERIASPQASETARMQASQQDSLLADIRKTIKVQGKEVSYVRLTQQEKNQLADIIYSYKRQGVKTTETEISRIAINYLIEDYQANGQASILARLLVLLNA